LQKVDMAQIVTIQLQHLAKRLKDRNLNLQWNDEAVSWLSEAAYDAVYGARPLKRVIQRQVQDPLALKILEGSVKDGDTVNLDVDGDGLSITQI
jgi:ATP-dependent Clp protease ATP-binding subunit ClpB